MGDDASKSMIAAVVTESCPRLIPARREAMIQELEALGEDVVGPDLHGLMELVEETLELAQRSSPAVDESLSDFVPEHLRAAFDAREEICRKELRKLITQARKVQKLMPMPTNLASAEIDPFASALTRLCSARGPVSSDGTLKKMINAIQSLAKANLHLEDHEKPGTRPIYNLARLVTRAGYYYRDLHELSLELNFDYTDRTGAKPGTRSREGDLEPRTATAMLACALIKAFDVYADIAEVQTHLRNYDKELKFVNRRAQRADFQLGFV